MSNLDLIFPDPANDQIGQRYVEIEGKVYPVAQRDIEINGLSYPIDDLISLMRATPRDWYVLYDGHDVKLDKDSTWHDGPFKTIRAAVKYVDQTQAIEDGGLLSGMDDAWRLQSAPRGKFPYVESGFYARYTNPKQPFPAWWGNTRIYGPFETKPEAEEFIEPNYAEHGWVIDEFNAKLEKDK
jgi:hypothetical protein